MSVLISSYKLLNLCSKKWLDLTKIITFFWSALRALGFADGPRRRQCKLGSSDRLGMVSGHLVGASDDRRQGWLRSGRQFSSTRRRRLSSSAADNNRRGRRSSRRRWFGSKNKSSRRWFREALSPKKFHEKKIVFFKNVFNNLLFIIVVI